MKPPEEIREEYDGLLLRINKKKNELDALIGQCRHKPDFIVCDRDRTFCSICGKVFWLGKDPGNKLLEASFIRKLRSEIVPAQTELIELWAKIEQLRSGCPHPERGMHPEIGDYCKICEKDWCEIEEERLQKK